MFTSKPLHASILASALLVLATSCTAQDRGSGGDASAKSDSPPQPTQRMQQVLDAHASLNPKPIDTLPPEEARKQPSPADGVKALLQKEGKPANPEPVGNVADRTIPGATGEIPARVYSCRTRESRRSSMWESRV